MTTGSNPPFRRLPEDVQVEMILGGDRGEWALIANLALLPFLSSEQPCMRKFQAHGVSDPESILPDDAATTRQVQTPTATNMLIVGEGWTGTITVHPSGDAFIQVAALSDELAQLVCKQIAAKVPAPTRDAGQISMIFWHHTGGGVRQFPREIEAPGWEDLRGNYPTDARLALDRLMTLAAPDTGGRLVLLHGEPGTGKTTALRALARMWGRWCRTEYIVDSDRLFSLPSYLLEVITAAQVALPGVRVEPRPWRLLIVEDCDELIRADAKNAAGQALSRLLNVTDGMVGQGLKVLVCITTNEDVRRLHPAITRPGRCLANIAVGRFDRAEAAAWLGSPTRVPAGGATLAELYALRGDRSPVVTKPVAGSAGGYL